MKEKKYGIVLALLLIGMILFSYASFFMSPVRAIEPNLIKNPWMEDISPYNPSMPTYWYPGQWGNNEATFTYPIVGRDGGYAVQVEVTRHTSGSAEWVFERVPVKPGVTYSYSSYYKSTAPSEIILEYEYTNGSVSYESMYETVNPTPEWSYLELFFTVPSGVKKMTLTHQLETTGVLAIDDTWLVDAGNKIFASGMVSLTFDDNYWDGQDVILPALQNAGIKGSFYVYTMYTKGNQNWDLPPIQRIYYDGHETSPHTRTHAYLPSLTGQALRNEVGGSRQDLLGFNISPASTFAYPYGAFNSETIQAVKDAGYIGARGVYEGFNLKDNDRYTLVVQNIRNTTTPEEIKGWIDTAMQDNSWLILVYHEVNYNYDEYGTTPERFREVVNYISQNGIPTVTVAEGIGKMNFW